MGDQSQAASQRRLRIFLCHSSDDKSLVRILYHRLKACNIDPWLDEEQLVGGENWRRAIRKAVQVADVVIVCLSRRSINKRGFVQLEIKLALDEADKQPEDTIFIIPLKLEECKLPDRLSDWHVVNYFEEDGFDRLIRALKRRAESIGPELAPIDCQASVQHEPFSLDKSSLPLESTILSSQSPQLITSTSPRTSYALKKGISRRTVIIGLLGLAGVSIVASSTAWLTHSQRLRLPLSPVHSVPTATTVLHPIGTTLYTYSDRANPSHVHAVAWSPDDTRIASGGDDNTVQVWDATSGGHLLTYRGHTGNITDLNWSPDGTRIASSDTIFDNTVQVWDAATGTPFFTYRGHDGNVLALAWSPDGRRIATGGFDKTVQVWDAATGNLFFIYHGHSNFVDTVAWSRDGTRIASAGGDNTVRVWDAATGTPFFTYRGHSTYVSSLAWSPDGKRIASGSADTTVQVWDATSGDPFLTYRGHFSMVFATAWLPHGRHIASGGGDWRTKNSDKTVQVWDAMTGNLVFTYYGHSDVVWKVVWSHHGKLIASGSSDNTVKVWQAV